LAWARIMSKRKSMQKKAKNMTMRRNGHEKREVNPAL
jgi:hypothetical protein